MSMLRIRAEQIPSIAPGDEAFVERMTEHLRVFYPRECEGLDDERLRAVVAHGIAKATGYGIHAQQDVCKLLGLMCTFGLDFDLDPSMPWAAHHLEQSARRGPTLQINRLVRHAYTRIDHACGLWAQREDSS